ncbi:MAG: DUF5103 domain-containing protein [Muribaculaceae bacterium]|nr:DUF5103 domain-containing protein [Muribaculaceae bacterium]
MKLHFLRVFIAFVAVMSVCGDSWGKTRENTMTGIFNPDFRTLTIGIEGDPLAPPVLTLGSADRLVIGFDALREERDYLRYSIYHCDADWNLSDLVDAEVFDGFNYADVEQYEFSRGTAVHYVHYTITLPNDAFSFRLSGNYLLRLYPEDNPDDIILQARFMVSEGVAAVGGEATSRTDWELNGAYQQLSLAVDLNRYPVRDIYNDLKINVTQNGRLDNAARVSHPSRVAGSRAVYEHIPQLIFRAGNEYRRMETVQMTYPGMGVETIDYHAPYYHHMLSVAEPRHSRSYLYDSTQHGRFFVREYNSSESDTEADYSVVHFTLAMLPVPDMDVYIDGDLTCRHFDDASRMRYDTQAGVYHKAMLLKQGAYNYQFLALPRGGAPTAAQPLNNGVERPALTSEVEGDFYQTVNEYLVTVYYRAPGERYDRLLGYTLIFSGR